MARIKFTKNELKKQKESLTRFERFLPTLLLKKQQLQLEIRRIQKKIDELDSERTKTLDRFSGWISLLAEDVGIDSILSLESLDVEAGNIAGIDIPIFSAVRIGEADYDLFETPLWTDRAVAELKNLARIAAERHVLDLQLVKVEEELKVTSQRVNLFEKVKIPESRENIRVIKIYLGDQQTAEVVRGKIAKKKIDKGAARR